MFYFVLGFVSCFVLFLVAYAVVRELIFRHGKKIVGAVQNEISRLADKSIDNATIIYPKLEEELFEAGASIDKLLRH